MVHFDDFRCRRSVRTGGLADRWGGVPTPPSGPHPVLPVPVPAPAAQPGPGAAKRFRGTPATSPTAWHAAAARGCTEGRKGWRDCFAHPGKWVWRGMRCVAPMSIQARAFFMGEVVPEVQKHEGSCRHTRNVQERSARKEKEFLQAGSPPLSKGHPSGPYSFFLAK